MFIKIIKDIFVSRNKRVLNKYEVILKKINILEEKMKNSINIPKSETVVKNLPTDTPVRLSQIKSKPATDPYRETL